MNDPSTLPRATKRARAQVVLGIDPGTRILGYGAIVLGARGPRLLAAGVVRARHDDVPARLGHLRHELDQLFERLSPDVIVVEQAFAARNVQSALRIGEGRGVVLCCAAHRGAEIVQYAPAVAKKSLVGSGAADKTQVARMVEHLLGKASAALPIDASDALALALCHAQRCKLALAGTATSQSARRAVTVADGIVASGGSAGARFPRGGVVAGSSARSNAGSPQRSSAGSNAGSNASSNAKNARRGRTPRTFLSRP